MLEDIGLPALGSLDPVVWFGILEAVSLLLGLVAPGVVRRFDRLEEAGLARVLFALAAVQVATVAIFALAGHFALAVAASGSTT